MVFVSSIELFSQPKVTQNYNAYAKVRRVRELRKIRRAMRNIILKVKAVGLDDKNNVEGHQ